jgi:hypothetical protein
MTYGTASGSTANRTLHEPSQAKVTRSSPATTVLGARQTKMVAAVTQNTNDNRIACDEQEQRGRAPKLPSQKYQITIGILMELLFTPDKVNLLQLWHQWANSADAFSSCAPVVSPKLMQDLLSFVFISDTPDDIKTGIQPFVIIGTAEHHLANLQVSHMYSFLSSGATLQLSDLELLKT